MTAKLQEAIERVQNLSEEQQDLVAAILLDAVSTSERITADPSIKDRLAAFKEYLNRRTIDVGLSLEATRRVNMYD